MNAQLRWMEGLFQRLLRLCPPDRVRTWKPTDNERREYVFLLDKLLTTEAALHRERIRKLQDRDLREEVDESLAEFRRTLETQLDHLKSAEAFLSPRDPTEEWPAELTRLPLVELAFQQGLVQLIELEERGIRIGYVAVGKEEVGTAIVDVESAVEQVLFSYLIRFTPDEWLKRLGQLGPIRTEPGAGPWPPEMTSRLVELYRSYIFGNWIAVLVLARAVLEAAVLENCLRFKVPTHQPDLRRQGKTKRKDLKDLVEEILTAIDGCGNTLPSDIKGQMDDVRERANDELHLNRSRPADLPKQALIEIQNVRSALGFLYAARGPTSS